MHVVEYIVEKNPAGAEALCNKYQMPCDNEQEAADSLLAISAENETALKDVMSEHPDKDIIIELFAGKNQKKSCSFSNASGDMEGGNCGTCKACRLNRMQTWSHASAGGEQSAIKNYLAGDLMPVKMQTNTLLILGIVSAFTIALIVSTKKNS